jgi:hypothetical protein
LFLAAPTETGIPAGVQRSGEPALSKANGNPQLLSA